jgi:CheY-like chemotaxis protein
MSQPLLLVADDSSTVRKVFQLAFETEGVEVVVASGGREARRMAGERLPSMIIADTDMPGMDGFELCLALKRDPETRAVPVYLLTSALVEFDQARAERCGADGKLEKPFRSEEMVRKVKSAISQGPSHRAPQAPQAEEDTFQEFDGLVDDLLVQAEKEMMEEEMEKMEAAAQKAMERMMAGPQLATMVEGAVEKRLSTGVLEKAVRDSVAQTVARMEGRILAEIDKTAREVALKVAEDLVKKTIDQIRKTGRL